MSSGCFFSLPFGEHCEYVLQVLRKKGNCYDASSVTVACCQNSPADERAVNRAITNKNNADLGAAKWYQKKEPQRHGTLQSDDNCDDNCADRFHEAKALLSIAPSDLRQRLIHASDGPPTVIGTFKAERKREQELRDLLDVITALEEHDLERHAIIMVQASKILGRLYKGLEALQKQSPDTLPTICQLIDERLAERNNVELVFDAAEKSDQKGKKGKWMSFHANTARAVKRAANVQANLGATPQTSAQSLEKLDKGQRADQKRHEKLPTLILSVVDRLISKFGGQALLVCRAFQIECFVFKETVRLIADIEIPILEHYITCRLETFNFSTINSDLDIECPLSQISWGLKKTVHRVCELLVLPNFQQIKMLDVSVEMNKLESNWKITVNDPRFSSDIEWRLQRQAELEHNAARALKISLHDLRNHHPHPSKLQGLHCLADVTLCGQNTCRAMALSQAGDSGYGTDVAESMAGTQQLGQPHDPQGYAFPFHGHLHFGSPGLSQDASSHHRLLQGHSPEQDGTETQLRSHLTDDPPAPPSAPGAWTCDHTPAMYFPSTQMQTPMPHPSGPAVSPFVVGENDVSFAARRSTTPPSSQFHRAAVRRPASDSEQYSHSSKRPRTAARSNAQTTDENHENFDAAGQLVPGRHYDPIHDCVSGSVRADVAAVEITPTELHTTSLANDERSLPFLEALDVVEGAGSIPMDNLHSLPVEGGVSANGNVTHTDIATFNNNVAEQALDHYLKDPNGEFRMQDIDAFINGFQGWYDSPPLIPSTPVGD